ncbi:MAG: UDP-N-acetylglucosamine 2-epimerase (hydrolyzing) [Magnetospirillum sp.]|nr:UDP-N-acetylglucosamine 2-epimerase (hydrolyzing) [Magnetospirillum sp.]
MTRRRRICLFTGTRAEWGLLSWLACDLKADPTVDLSLLVSGSHLSPQFGETWKAIAAEGFDIAEKVEMLLDSDSRTGMATSMGLGTMRTAEALARLAPDILVLLGDRTEVLAAASAATCLGIPIAHLHGGEASEGAIDDAIRNAVTALAHLHFPAAEPYRRRIVQMGVAPERVILAGAPGLDNLARLPLLDRDALEAELGFSLAPPLLMATYHPVTAGSGDPVGEVAEVCAGLDRVPDARVIVSRANQDAGARAINAFLDDWAGRRPERVRLVSSLGTLRYLSVVKLAAAVVGNSSSGVIEAPAAGTAVVNIGDRQKGRLRAPGIIDCPCRRDTVAAAIAQALTPEHQALAKRAETPYGTLGASARIARVLATVEIAPLLNKPFRDLEFTCP